MEVPGPRPVWAALDAAGARGFTGELTLAFEVPVRVWFVRGRAYLAERDGGPHLEDLLLSTELVSAEQLDQGAVELAGPHDRSARHLGRLFDLVPELDRSRVEVFVEHWTTSVLAEIAHRTVPDVGVAAYRMHASGIHRWADAPSRPEPLADRIAEPGARLTQFEVVEVAPWHDPSPADEARHQVPVPLAPIVPPFAPPGVPAAAAAPAALEPAGPAAPAARQDELTKVIEEIAREGRSGAAPAIADGDVSEDVRAAVRLALAEIQAATRPPVTHGLSIAALDVTDPSPEPEAVDRGMPTVPTLPHAESPEDIIRRLIGERNPR